MVTATNQNMLLVDVEYKIDETAFGRWKRFLFPNGQLFREFTSHVRIFGLPLLHFTWGICPETGKSVAAKGVIAVGRKSVGAVAIGQFSAGIVVISQFGLGVLFGFGQFVSGALAIGQFAIGAVFGLGQFATGLIAIGQFGLGQFVLAQFGLGQHVWDMRGVSPIARLLFTPVVAFFR